MKSFSVVFCSINDFDESYHKPFNFDFSIILIGLINCGKWFLIGVRARFPSTLITKLLSDFERFDTERCWCIDESFKKRKKENWVCLFEIVTIVSITAVDRSFGVVGENNVDNVDVLFANESPMELCRLSVPILWRRRRGDVRRSLAPFVFITFGERKSESSSAWRIPEYEINSYFIKIQILYFVPRSLQSLQTAAKTETEKSALIDKIRRSGSCKRIDLCTLVKCSWASDWTPYWSSVHLVFVNQIFIFGHQSE